MKILEVNTRETAETITIFAKCKIRHIGYDEAYFTFDKMYKPFLKVDASPFAAALLIPSMRMGEDLIIKGKISKELYDGMHKIMELFLSWNIGLKPIEIIADELVTDTANPTITATFFSGGVDSFYTYLKHKKDKKDPVTHLLLVKGYDIDSRNENLWKATLKNIQKVAKAEKAELIVAESNLRTLIDPIFVFFWDYYHGGCLAAAALCLRKGIKQVYVPSSLPASEQVPWGTHLDADAYWSTEKIKFSHDGGEASRVDKINWEIAKSPTALKYLRVCYMNEVGAFNCGACEKCLRTMINLYAAGVLDKAKTFPHTIDPKKVAVMKIDKNNQELHRDNLRALIKYGAPKELQDAQRACIASLKNIDTKEEPFIKRVAHLIYLDQMYLRGNLYKFAQGIIGRKF